MKTSEDATVEAVLVVLKSMPGAQVSSHDRLCLALAIIQESMGLKSNA